MTNSQTQPATIMRPAFSMITAIFVIMIMSSVGAFVLNLSGKMIQETTTQYRKEQAILYAKSYTEYAILAATSRNCIRNITANVDGNNNKVREGEGYHIEVRVLYLGANSACANQVGTTNLAYPDTAVLIDTYVRYRDPQHPQSLSTVNWTNNPGITYHRRTLQRL
jgi:type II secretory pathway pseudopilin PulG